MWQAGLLGLGLGVGVVILTGIPLFLAGRAIGGNGVAGVAAASTAGNTAAAAVIVTTVLTPLLTAWTARRVAPQVEAPAEEEDAAVPFPATH